MSAEPRAGNWKCFIAAGDVLSFLRMGGRFADAARENFQVLEISDNLGVLRKADNPFWADTSEGTECDSHLRAALGEDLLNCGLVCGLLEGLGASLSILFINLSVPIRDELSSCLSKFCKAVRHLQFSCMKIVMFFCICLTLSVLDW